MGVGGERGMEATGDQGGGVCRWEMMLDWVEAVKGGREAGWDNGYSWTVKPLGRTNRSGVEQEKEFKANFRILEDVAAFSATGRGCRGKIRTPGARMCASCPQFTT